MKVRNNWKCGYFVVALGIVLLTFTGMAGADEDVSGDYVLEDTTVTATKTGETNLQETPISITAFSEEMLKDSGVFKLSDMSLFIPNAEFHNTLGFTQTYIRGIGNQTIGPLGGETNVAYYVDGVYIDGGAGLTSDFVDIERIEVLRGPQGTLYGRNANGGAINFITKDPSDELEAKIVADLGSFNKRRIDASISGPIVKDKVKMRLVVSDMEKDGYMNNIAPGQEDPGSQDSTGFRTTMILTPTDNLAIRFSGDYADIEGSGMPVKMLSDQGYMGGVDLPPFLPPSPHDYTLPSDFFDVEQNTGSVEETVSGGSVKIDYRITDNLSIRSISAIRNYEKLMEQDTDGSFSANGGYATYDLETDQFTQELQLQGNWNRFTGLFGIFYHHSETSYKQDVEMDHIMPGMTSSSYGDLETDSWALFSNLRYSATDTIGLEAGVRYSVDDKSQDLTFLPRFAGGVPEPPANLSDDWSAVTPRFAADWRPSEDLMMYASVAKGYRSGDFFVFNTASGTDTSIDPEIVWNYEIGVKKDWFEKRLRTNMAVFYSDYKDMQVVTGDEFGRARTDNASSAEIKGVELEVIARPIQGLTLNGTLSYLDATYGEYSPNSFAMPPVAQSAEGNQLFGVPEWKVAVGAQYVYTVGNLGFLTVRGDLAWKDDIHYDSLENPEFVLPSHTVVNGLLRFETTDDSWAVELYGKNLFDEEYHLYKVGLLPPSDVTAAPAEGRTFGVRLTYNF